MAFQTVGGANADGSAGSTTIILTKPTGVTTGDIMFAIVGSADSALNSTPSGWTSLGTALATYNWQLLYKVAGGSEPVDYTFGVAASTRMYGIITAWRDGFDTSNPIDVVSNTGYITSDTTVRAASMSVASANSPILFFGCLNRTTSTTYTEPSVPAAFIERADQGGTAPDMWMEVAYLVWSGSGATGNMDATANATITAKHAFAVALRQVSTTSIKTVNGLAEATVKTVDGLANASVKTFNGLA